MKEIKAEVISLTFTNSDNGYAVARVQATGEPGQVTVCGYMGNLVPGEMLQLKGEWKEHPKYGRQFMVQEFEQLFPASISGIKRYLASGMIKGVGPIMAGKMVEGFGEKVLDILDSDPDRLLEVEGIGQKKLAKIKSSWSQQREIRNLMLFLQTYQIPTTFAARIYRKYGNESIQKLKDNPYDLVYEIRGIGFITADRMAIKLGLPPDSQERLQAGIAYQLFQFAEQGHLFYPAEDLLNKVQELLGDVSLQKIQTALNALEERKRVIVQDLPEQGISRAVYLSFYYKVELDLAQRLCSLSTHPAALSPEKVSDGLERLERQEKIRLTPEQRQAVVEGCLNKTYIITGGPGTGKTTITRMLVRTFRDLGLKIKLAAPTGRASKRLSQATGAGAATIHRMLGFNPSGGFEHNEDNKIKAEAVIVDEVSMLDAALMVQLLRALPVTCRLVLVGDVNQLPAVGPGNVLKDILESETVPRAVLTSIFRQARESSIVVNAHRINMGEFPVASNKKPPQADFFWVQQDDLSRIQELITYMVCQRIPAVYNLDPIKDIQVLTPMHKGDVGTSELNRLLQERLNPGPDAVVRGYRRFRVNDRVLQMRNNYEKDVYNGDLGWITRVNLEDSELSVDYDGKEVVYDLDDLDELTLAYAVSVHKSQGSEYPAVVMPVVTQHYLLLQRNLIYTGLTRARSLAVLIGSTKAMAMGLRSTGASKRYTHLRYRLQQAFQ
ncbi:ATP-dependent RecD-like DNA helicase [Desulfonatronospira sp.]|uniref:SF1B family DNA helicase RecD2 n=1 Tax=Desulfonatronospira sp. TaxID=1962951 RepID=UPI0025B956D8|nr:ATP-dependent RecD-like DNA helicase [Desulfonatronospira sp.]